MNRWIVSTSVVVSLLVSLVTDAAACCAPSYPMVTAVTKTMKTSDGGGFLIALLVQATARR